MLDLLGGYRSVWTCGPYYHRASFSLLFSSVHALHVWKIIELCKGTSWWKSAFFARIFIVSRCKCEVVVVCHPNLPQIMPIASPILGSMITPHCVTFLFLGWGLCKLVITYKYIQLCIYSYRCIILICVSELFRWKRSQSISWVRYIYNMLYLS